MCSYNCSGPPPPLTGDNDINGIGVIINYIATAGIAVLVIVIYYLAVYEPALDAFTKLESNEIPMPFRPNPVDVVLLQWVRHWPRKLLGSLSVGVRNPARLESTFIKCFLAMSDLQIVTGFSILISGFAQFPCGLSTYYWMLIVELAWFSSLTHLSCLTLLRAHLYKRTTERAWRLFAMGAMAGLLVIGLIFTGNYHWAYETNTLDPQHNRPGLYDQAICFLDVKAERSFTFYSMLFSIGLIIMAFISRVIKLHRTLSVNLVGRVRARAGIGIRGLLRIIYNWSNPKPSPASLKNMLCYRPALAIYLELRALVDGWTSMGVEVGWLLLAFGWGIARLRNTMDWQSSSSLTIEDDDSSEWSFGQVVSMVLLAAPIITILEYFDHNAQNDNATGVSAEVFELLPQPPRFGSTLAANGEVVDFDDPDNDWHHIPNTAAVTFIFSCFTCIIMSLFFFIYGAIGSSTPINALTQLFQGGYIALSLPSLVMVILYSLAIQSTMSSRFWRAFWESLNVSYHIGFLIVARLYWGAMVSRYVKYLLIASAGLYVLFSLCYRARHYKLA